MANISLDQARLLGLKRYFTGAACPHGHIADRNTSNQSCVECSRISSRERTRKLRATNPRYRDSRREYLRNLRSNPDYIAKLRAKERAKYAADAEHRKDRLRHAKQYRETNLKRIVGRNSFRNQGRAQRTPQWADRAAISAFYENCQDGSHVDHVIPLHGKNVSGLHVIGNLQYLTSTDNIRKGNKFHPEMVNV